MAFAPTYPRFSPSPRLLLPLTLSLSNAPYPLPTTTPHPPFAHSRTPTLAHPHASPIQLHEQLGEPEAVVSTLSGLSSLHSAIGEADEAVACLERALADVQERMDRYAIHPPNPSVCVRYPVRHSLTHMHTRPRTSTDTHSSFDLRRRCRTTCSCVARS